MDVFDPATSPALADLNRMPGCAKVKARIQALVARCLEHQSQGSKTGEKAPLSVPLHCTFLGNPGTGKTAVARIYGDLLKELGLLSEGGFTVVTASALVGEAVGEAASLTAAALKAAQGKVLLIDEAYALDPHGRAVLDTLVEKLDAEGGKDIAVVLAGYKSPMEALLRNFDNPGLQARGFSLAEAIHFDDLTDADLEKFLVDHCRQRALALEAPTVARVVQALASERASGEFANARSVINFVDRARRQREERMRKQAASLLEEDFFPPAAGAAACAGSREQQALRLSSLCPTGYDVSLLQLCAVQTPQPISYPCVTFPPPPPPLPPPCSGSPRGMAASGALLAPIFAALQRWQPC